MQIKLLLKPLAFLAIGLIGGYFIHNLPQADKKLEPDSREVRLGGHRFTNPLLECEYNQAIGEKEYKPSKRKVEDVINKRRQNGDVTHVSVYYRDLNNGPWFGINEKENYSPSSLLKLPVMMAYYKLADSDPSILQKQIAYKKKFEPIEQIFIPQKTLEDGKPYTIGKLIEYMMLYSDNNSLFLLEENIDNERIDQITKDLGIETPNDQTPEDYLSVKSYATLIRVLFNASYISRSFSEKALQIMAKSYFEEGLVQGVPKGIEVANKFGERELPNGIKQLHDCGIIYYTSHPYLLCIMTRGTNYESLSQTIGEISKTIYGGLDNQYNK